MQEDLAKQIEVWVEENSGVFTTLMLYSELGVTDLTEMAAVRKILKNLRDSGKIEQHNNKVGCYRILDTTIKPIDFMNCTWEKDIHTKKGYGGIRILKDRIDLGDEKGYFYTIDFDRIDTKAKLLEWVYHLSAKNWVSREQLWCLMTFCQDRFGYNCYNN